MADKLLPCPFCGGEAEWSYLVPDGAIIGCKDAYSANPKCRIRPEIRRYRGDKEKSLEVAISDWNTRPSNWHTGTPTETGRYLVSNGYDTSISYFDGKSFIKNFLAFPDVGEIVKWQKINEEGEEVNGSDN